MQAGMEGAGRERSVGVSIRLPFEAGANSIIAGDDKHVAMKYFFTRKLMLVKESAAFVCLPGGFGTLDETFELLTLTQTGKACRCRSCSSTRPAIPTGSTSTGSRSSNSSPRPDPRGRHLAVHHHRLVRRRSRGHRTLLRQLPLDPQRR
ncbi:MAG: LOG family protein [Ilumatobacteraceae bacterium]